MTEPSHAVFLSYASQDAEAAQKICEALRAAGIEVWFDQSELRGGDSWDQSIRKQIKTCALFIPLISHTTHDRREGYFRLEWKLAVDRCHLMDANMAFLLPVVIDDTRDDDERVPERFREVQWTRLPGGITPPAFVERVRRLLSGELAQEPKASAAPTIQRPILASWRVKTALLGIIALFVVAFGYLVANRLAPSKPGAEVAGAPTLAAQSAAAHRQRLQPAAALDRGAAIREPERRQGAGVLLRRAHRRAAEFFGRDRRAAGGGPHLCLLVQGKRQRHRRHRPQAERCDGARRKRTAFRAHRADYHAAHQYRHGVPPVVKDL